MFAHLHTARPTHSDRDSRTRAPARRRLLRTRRGASMLAARTTRSSIDFSQSRV